MTTTKPSEAPVTAPAAGWASHSYQLETAGPGKPAFLNIHLVLAAEHVGPLRAEAEARNRQLRERIEQELRESAAVKDFEALQRQLRDAAIERRRLVREREDLADERQRTAEDLQSSGAEKAAALAQLQKREAEIGTKIDTLDSGILDMEAEAGRRREAVQTAATRIANDRHREALAEVVSAESTLAGVIEAAGQQLNELVTVGFLVGKLKSPLLSGQLATAALVAVIGAPPAEKPQPAPAKTPPTGPQGGFIPPRF
jgi:hypothetical protein